MSAMPSYAFPLVTVADAESMSDDGNRYEVVDGVLFRSTAPNYLHQTIAMNLGFEIHSYLRSNPLGRVVAGVGLVFDDFNGVIPDLVYASHERLTSILRDGRLIAAPEIAVEILSPGASNERRDRLAKRQLYSGRGVQEYWIVDPQARTVEVNIGQNTVVLAQGEVLTTPLLPGFSLPIEKLFL